MKNLKHLLLVMSVLFIMLLLALPVYAGEIVIDSYCYLAHAIKAANEDRAVGGCPAGSGADVITLSADITLKAELPRITSDITIEGGGFTIFGNDKYRVLYVDSGGNLRINQLTVADGKAPPDGDEAGRGGGIYVAHDGAASISGSSFAHNSAAGSGGAITNSGELSINYSSFTDNFAKYYGGAIRNSGELNISDSSFSGNSAGSSGAISNRWGELNISNGSFSGNTANDAGAIGNVGELSIRNSTFSGNSAENNGGVIYIWDGALNIRNSIFADNSAVGDGAVIYNEGELDASNSIFSRNFAENDGGIYISFRGVLVGFKSNIIASNRDNDCGLASGSEADSINGLAEDGSCSAALSEDPMLGELVVPADGSPAYFPLLPGSSAIDAGDDDSCPDTDQIGTPRPQGEGCDIGAIEFQLNSSEEP